MTRSFKFYLGAFSALGVAISSWRLYSLTQQQELWSWWPLALLLGIWGLVVSFRQNPLRLNYLALSTVGGSCLALGFPPLPTWPLIAFGFACMLYQTDSLYRDGLSVKQQWWYSYHTLILYNIGATWWVANTALAAGIVANFLNALLMSVPWALIFLLRKYMPKVWLGASIVLWIGFEYLHYNWQIAWPWLAFGNSLASTPTLAQWYSITGIFGGSFYLCLAGVLVYRVARAARLGHSLKTASLQTATWILLPALLSLMLLALHENQLQAGETATVTAIQPNYEPHYQKFAGNDRQQLENFMALIASSPADLVVLPETSFGPIDESVIKSSDFFNAWKAYVAQNPQQYKGLLVGLSTYQRLSENDKNPALRKQEYPGGKSLYYVSNNSAFGAEGADELGIYYKSKLVPGVEFLPYRKALFFFNPLVEALGGTTAGLGVNDSVEVFRYACGIQAAPLICYESIYGDYVREFVAKGANLLVVPTNDGWWDNTPGHIQHLQFAQLRAIENRRYVVQAANTGISAIINTKGELLSSTSYNEATALNGQVAWYPITTFYTKYGDQLGRLASGTAILVLLSLVGAIWRSRDPMRQVK